MSKAPAKTRIVVPTLAKATIGSAWRSEIMPVAAMLPRTVATADVLCMIAPPTMPSAAQDERLLVECRMSDRSVRDVLS